MNLNKIKYFDIITYNKFIGGKKLNFNKYKEKYYYAYLLCLTFITSLSLNSNPFSNTELNHDSGMFQYFGYAMNKGLVIYRDIFDHKGPIIFIINYLSVLLGDFGLYIIEFIFIYIFFLYGYKLANIYLKNINIKILIVTITSLFIYYLYDGGNTVEGYAVSFIMISLYIFTKYYFYYYVKILDIVILGLCFAIVSLIRINMVSLWGVFIIAIMIELLIYKKYKELVNYIFYFSIGLFAIYIPITIYLYLNDSLYQFFYQSILFNIFYLGDGEGLINVVKFFTSRVPILIMIIILGFFVGVTKTTKYIFIVYISIILTIISILLSNRPYQHYVIVILPFIVLALTFIFKKINIYINLFKYFIAFTIMLSPVLIENTSIVISKNFQPSNRIIKYFREAYVFSEDNFNYKNNINYISKYVEENTKEDEYIYTHRMSGNIYLSTNRLSNTKFFALPSADITNLAELKQEFFSDMRQKKAKLIIVRKKFIKTEQLGFEKEFKEYLFSNYRKKKEIEDYFIYEISQ